MKLGAMKNSMLVVLGLGLALTLKMAKNINGLAITAQKVTAGGSNAEMSDNAILNKNLRAIIKSGGDGVRPLLRP